MNDMRAIIQNMPKSCPGSHGDGLTARDGTRIGAGEKEGLKSAVKWIGAEREAELARRDVERLRERGWL